MAGGGASSSKRGRAEKAEELDELDVEEDRLYGLIISGCLPLL